MIKLGSLIGLDLKLREKGEGSLSDRSVALRVSVLGLELAHLIQALNEGEEFVVVLEGVKPQLPLEYAERKEE